MDLLSEVEYFIIFIESNFTDDFFRMGNGGLKPVAAKEIACVLKTIKEKKREVHLIGINLHGARLDLDKMKSTLIGWQGLTEEDVEYLNDLNVNTPASGISDNIFYQNIVSHIPVVGRRTSAKYTSEQFDEVYAKGKHEGDQEGFKRGQAEGYKAGHAAGLQERETLEHEKGYKQGYDEGYAAGLQKRKIVEPKKSSDEGLPSGKRESIQKNVEQYGDKEGNCNFVKFPIDLRAILEAKMPIMVENGHNDNNGVVARYKNYSVYIPYEELTARGTVDAGKAYAYTLNSQGIYVVHPQEVQFRYKLPIVGGSLPKEEITIIASRSLAMRKGAAGDYGSNFNGNQIEQLAGKDHRGMDMQGGNAKNAIVEIASKVCFIKDIDKITSEDIYTKNFEWIVWQKNNHLTSIEQAAFAGCEKLVLSTESYTENALFIPRTVCSIKRWAFANCYGLRKVFIPSGVSYMEQDVFIGCSKDLQIYCAAKRQPDGWDIDWARTLQSTQVHWGAQIDSNYHIS